MENFPSELNSENLEGFLAGDPTFVDYFNTFLSLPCFPERIFYNKDLDLLEQFSQRLAKDENDNVQLSSRPSEQHGKTKHGPSYTIVQISYCVTILDRGSGFEWLKKYRLPEFLKSKLYAEYRLSKILSSSQATYIETIRNDIQRVKECNLGSQRLTSVSSIDEGNNLINLEENDSDIESLDNQSDSIEQNHTTFNEARIDSNYVTFASGYDEKISNYFNNSDGNIPEESTTEGRELKFSINVEEIQEQTTITWQNELDNIDKTINRNKQCFPNSETISGSENCEGKIDPSFITSGSGTIRTRDNNSDNEIDIKNLERSNQRISGRNNVDKPITTPILTSTKATRNNFSSPVPGTQYERNSNSYSKIYDSKNESNSVDDSSSKLSHFSDESSRTLTDPTTSLQRQDNSSSIITKSGLIDDAGDDAFNSDIDADVASNADVTGDDFICSGVTHSVTSNDSICRDVKLSDVTESDVTGSGGMSTNINTGCELGNDGCDASSDVREKRFAEILYEEDECARCLLKVTEFESGEQEFAETKDDGYLSREDEGSEPRTGLSTNWENNANCDHSNLDKFSKEEEDKNNLTLEKSLQDDITYKSVHDTSYPLTEQSQKTSEINPSSDDSSAARAVSESDSCDYDTKIRSENEVEPNLLSNSAQVNSAERKSSDVMFSDIEETASFKLDKEVETDNESASELSSWKRISSQNSISSDSGREAGLEAEEMLNEPEADDRQADLSTKKGIDNLKEFLADTKGETLLLFWLQIELWKHLNDDEEKARLIQDMKDTFLKNGSPLELPEEIRRHIKFLVKDISETQRIVAQPLHTYWCPRFTLHQLRARAFGVSKQPTSCSTIRTHTSRKAWQDISHKDNALGIPHVNIASQLVRPHSSTSRNRHEAGNKVHARSKSAHARIITTPYHTNAGKKQLELYANPPPVQYGFHKRAVEAFPPNNDSDYLSPVRLVINPLSKPGLRNFCKESQDVQQSHEEHPVSSKNKFFPESLLDALIYNGETGNFFKEFINKQSNKLWRNCLLLWQSLMEYSAYFESATINPVLVTRKAKWIYARFIPAGSVCDIQLDPRKRTEVRRNLDPPYEELFDVVEEHVLACLKEPWDSLCRNERREYDMVPKKETLRYLEVNLKQTRSRSKSFGFQEELGGHDEIERQRGKFGIEEANSPIPVPKDGITFEAIIKERAELEGFQKFLEKKDPKGVKDLMAWTDMETFQRIPRSMEDKLNKKAREIRQGYLNSKYFFGPDSPATKEAQSLILSMNGSSRIKELPSASLISECQKYVRCRIERRWLALYKESQEYKDRKNPKQNISDVVEDIMLRRRLQRSEAAWRVLNSRWVSSSRDIVALRQTLNNPESCLAFRKFVSLKGDTYENDVLFWIEVQKYKDLCHRHASEKCIKQKVQAITDCFIASSIPPELQIDVPIEMAEKLMERITSRNPNIGPYLFREVQMTVFRVLFNMWKEFCTFRSTINDGSLIDVLEKKLQRHRMEVRLKREANEKRKLAKQEAEKRKKEKEEKERKELKSVEQLVSLMNEPSLWEQDEEDVVLWRYSKHISANKVSEKNKSALAETSSLMALTNQRSLTTKSSYYVTNSIENERNPGRDRSVSQSSRLRKSCGSILAETSYSNESRRSKKVKKSKNLLIPRIPHTGSSAKSDDVVLEKITGNEKPRSPKNKKDNQVERTTLLKNRRRKESRRISDKELAKIVSRERCDNDPRTKDPNDEDLKVDDPGAQDSRAKVPGAKSRQEAELVKRKASETSCVKPSRQDGFSIGSDETGGLRMNVLRRSSRTERNKPPVSLTSELLKDFTNSPEGAQLDIPLPLIRISESQSVNRDQSSSLPRQTNEKTLKQGGWNTTNKIGVRYRHKHSRNETLEYVADVIVN